MNKRGNRNFPTFSNSLGNCKRGKQLFVFSSAIFQIIILIGLTVWVAVMFGRIVGADPLDALMANRFGDQAASVGAGDNALSALGPSSIDEAVNPLSSTGAGPASFPSLAEQAAEQGVDAPAGVFSQSQLVGEGGTTTSVWSEAFPKSGPFAIFQGQGYLGGMVSGLLWAGIAGGAAYFLAGLFGLSKDNAASIGLGVGAGTFTGYFLSYGLGWNGIASTLIGAGVGIAIIVLTYKKEKTELIRFECLPWEAPTGGKDCEKCNENPDIPCSEYRCRSLGQACQIVNEGTENELCVWVSPNDVTSPRMEPWEEALSPEGLRYIPDNTITPPNTGAKIYKNGAANGCLQAYTKLEFGLTTDEPAKCRLDYELKPTFGEMQFLFGGTNEFGQEHKQTLRVPDNSPAEGDEITPSIFNGGSLTLFAKWIDANGNGEDSGALAFKFCVEEGPDTSQPVVEGTSINDGSPVQFNVDSVPIEVYVNEPAECRWSRQDKAFDDMENAMSCATETFQINANLQYVCTGDLTGIKDRENNQFYFRCRDYDGNEMATSTKLNLLGTEELVIDSVGPTGTVEGGTVSAVTVELTAETSHGANNGAATCYFSSTGTEGTYREMLGSGTHTHSQNLDLTAGNYEYFFKCVDAGGNSAYENTTFIVFVDTLTASVTRAYRKGDTLTVVTSEAAQCSYSLNGCGFNFDEGQPLLYENPSLKTAHYAAWDATVTYYIKCRDLQGNEPSPNACSIAAEASEL